MFRPSFTGMVILDKQEKSNLRPKPYIVFMSATGRVTIGWSVSMKPIENPEKIPPTKVGVKSELMEFRSVALDKPSRNLKDSA